MHRTQQFAIITYVTDKSAYSLKNEYIERIFNSCSFTLTSFFSLHPTAVQQNYLKATSTQAVRALDWRATIIGQTMYLLSDFEMDEAVGWEDFNQIVLDEGFSLSAPAESEGIIITQNWPRHWCFQ